MKGVIVFFAPFFNLPRDPDDHLKGTLWRETGNEVENDGQIYLADDQKAHGVKYELPERNKAFLVQTMAL